MDQKDAAPGLALRPGERGISERKLEKNLGP
jgi:hypothetical protein